MKPPTEQVHRLGSRRRPPTPVESVVSESEVDSDDSDYERPIIRYSPYNQILLFFECEEDSEFSPHQLDQFRAHYNNKFGSSSIVMLQIIDGNIYVQINCERCFPINMISKTFLRYTRDREIYNPIIRVGTLGLLGDEGYDSN